MVASAMSRVHAVDVLVDDSGIVALIQTLKKRINGTDDHRSCFWGKAVVLQSHCSLSGLGKIAIVLYDICGAIGIPVHSVRDAYRPSLP